jgi:peptidoglycan-associated lipoprotein
MFKFTWPLALTAVALLLSSCGPKSVSGPKPEDTVLVNTTEIRPDWIEQLDLGERATVLEELEQEGLELRETALVDPNVWGDSDSPKITVTFDLDRWVVRAIDQAKVENAAKALMEKPNLQVLLTGFCDWRGTTEYNLALGEKRANSVRDYLIQLGVEPRRISVLSRGDLDAVVGATPAQMALERRVEILLVQ